MERDPYTKARILSGHPDVAGVRVSERRLVVAYTPDIQGSVETIPDSLQERLQRFVDESDWLAEYGPDSDVVGENAERHSWSGGRSNSPITAASEQPAGYELQVSFV